MQGSIAARCVALAGTGCLVAATVTACTVPASTPKPTTFQMYANVDAEGDLGSNVGALKVAHVQSGPQYTVTFNRPVGHCAAVAQVGKAGGPDGASFAQALVVPATTPSAFLITFAHVRDDGTREFMSEPFMLTVTCPG